MRNFLAKILNILKKTFVLKPKDKNKKLNAPLQLFLN